MKRSEVSAFYLFNLLCATVCLKFEKVTYIVELVRLGKQSSREPRVC